MNTKTINYYPKNTQAKTTYCEIDSKDMEYIQDQLLRYLCQMGELSINKNKDIKEFVSVFWQARNNELPKGVNGLNSPQSFVSGLLNNLKYGTQVDLTNKQLMAIEYISEVMVEFLDCVDDKNLNKVINNEKMVFIIGIL